MYSTGVCLTAELHWRDNGEVEGQGKLSSWDLGTTPTVSNLLVDLQSIQLLTAWNSYGHTPNEHRNIEARFSCRKHRYHTSNRTSVFWPFPSYLDYAARIAFYLRCHTP